MPDEEKILKHLGFVEDDKGIHYVLTSYIYVGRFYGIYYNLYMYDPETLEYVVKPVKQFWTPVNTTTRYEPYMKDVFSLVSYGVARNKFNDDYKLNFDRLDQLFRSYVSEHYEGTVDYTDYLSLDVPRVLLKKRKGR